jgi:hypothetical protein
LDERVGVKVRKAMVANFGSIVFLRGREEETDLLAAISLGTRERIRSLPTTTEEGSVLSINSGKVRESVWVCPPGELGRLAPHEGYAVSPGRKRSDLRLTFIPWFEEPKLHRASPGSEDPNSVEHLKRLLRGEGFREQMDQPVFDAAVDLSSSGFDREKLIEVTNAFFRARAIMVPRGLESLPSGWLKSLPGILLTTQTPQRTHLPYMICNLSQREGLLLMQFTQESICELSGPRISAWDRIRIMVNTSLYPSRCRPLTRRHRRQLQARWPEFNSANEPEMI